MDAQKGSFLPVIGLHFPWGLPQERQTGMLADYLCGCILPLLRVLHKLEEIECAYGMTISFSAELICQLEDKEICNRLLAELKQRVIYFTEASNTSGETRENLLNEARENLYWFEQKCQCRPFQAFLPIAALGNLELCTAPASYAPLPLLQGTPSALKQQLDSAAAFFQKTTGCNTNGILLPACGFFNGLEEYLSSSGFKWTLLSEKSFARADNPLLKGYRQPVLTPSKLTAFCINPQLQSQLTDNESGYACSRLNRSGKKNPQAEWKNVNGGVYCLQDAQKEADNQATIFLAKLTADTFNGSCDCIYLNGSFLASQWQEGLHFLYMLLLKMHYDQDKVQATTPSRYLQSNQPIQQATPGNGTSAKDGELASLYTDGIDSLLADLNLAQERLDTLQQSPSGTSTTAVLKQMIQELLLSQGVYKTAVNEFDPIARSRRHLSRFCALDKLVTSGKSDTQLLNRMQRETPGIC